jgi:phospholipid/cholesterol/gamma-HCH transport system permease protein
MLRLIQRLGDNVLYGLERFGMMGLFLAATLALAVSPPYRLQPLLKQIRFIGARSTLVIVVAGGFVGMVVALQFHNTLVRFGSVSLMGAAVGLSLVRELAPVLAALMVIGRAGSAICAEIGIMRSDEQIDALECMSIDPLRHLVAPRLLAGIISVPLLTAVFNVVGILGGFFIGGVLFEISAGAYFEGMYDSVLWSDIVMGFTKSVVFGLLIVWIATAKGFFMHLERGRLFGAEGVSRVTTDAVVLSSIAVLCADYLISAIML